MFVIWGKEASVANYCYIMIILTYLQIIKDSNFLCNKGYSYFDPLGFTVFVKREFEKKTTCISTTGGNDKKLWLLLLKFRNIRKLHIQPVNTRT